jgi:hypothetical protein
VSWARTMTLRTIRHGGRMQCRPSLVDSIREKSKECFRIEIQRIGAAQFQDRAMRSKRRPSQSATETLSTARKFQTSVPGRMGASLVKQLPLPPAPALPCHSAPRRSAGLAHFPNVASPCPDPQRCGSILTPSFVDVRGSKQETSGRERLSVSRHCYPCAARRMPPMRPSACGAFPARRCGGKPAPPYHQ